MLSARPPISNNSSHLTKPLQIVLSAQMIISITVTFTIHSFFSSLAKSQYLSLCSFSLFFHYAFRRESKVQYSAVSLCFFINYPKVTSCGRDKVICLSPQIQEYFAHLIFSDGFWFVFIPFGSLVIFHFLALSPISDPPHRRVYYCTLFALVCWIVWLGIDCFVFFTA